MATVIHCVIMRIICVDTYAQRVDGWINQYNLLIHIVSFVFFVDKPGFLNKVTVWFILLFFYGFI